MVQKTADQWLELERDGVYKIRGGSPDFTGMGIFGAACQRCIRQKDSLVGVSARSGCIH